MKKFRHLLVILLLIVTNHQAFGAIERFSNRLDNGSSPILSSGGGLELYDDKYFEMSTDPFWGTRYTNKLAKGMVRLGINPDLNLTSDFSGYQKVQISYWKWNQVTSVFDLTVVTKTFNLSYSTVDVDVVLDQSSFVFEGAHRISLRLMDGDLPLDKLFLEASIDVERYYVLNTSTVSGLTHTQFNVGQPGAINGPQIEFRWNTKVGAESYELEWVHINNYTLDGAQPLTESQLSYNFYLNSTRIETKDNWYRIPRIFDKGYIVYRVRPIGRNGLNFTTRQEGAWTVVSETGLLSSIPASNRIQITDEYSAQISSSGNPLDLNWVHRVTYAEDGKRLEGISYVDGLGRMHQSLGVNSVTGQALVSNVYYDEFGRAVVGDLPTPEEGVSMAFRPAFNKADGTLNPYSWHSLDIIDNQNVCILNSAGFSTTSGAGKYYSPSNPNQNGSNVAIPDAEKYPFSRVVFTNDYTNRVASVSTAGLDLKTGSNKETRFFYPSSNQPELNALFGTEVGLAQHYTKMITVDPNGQIYVQYTDMAERVVASYMEGPSPINLDGVEGNSSTNMVIPMIEEGSPQIVNTQVPYSEISYSQYISSDTTFTFNYWFTPSQFQSACTGTLCLDCIYDLEIQVYDQCGEELNLTGYDGTSHIIGSDIDDLINGTCNGNGTEDFEASFTSFLEKGMYTIHKKLTVNEAAVDEYWCLYMDANTCIEGVQSIFNEAYMAESFSGCEPEIIDDTPESVCDGYKQLLMADVSPGGQYGTYNLITGGSTDPYSVFNSSSTGELGVNWRTLTYLDENGTPVPAATLTGTAGLTWFVNNFREEWAEILIDYHPEHCELEFCYLNGASNEYDEAMLSINSYDAAFNQGYLMPLAGGEPNSKYTIFPSPAATAIPSIVDPFFIGGPDNLGLTYHSDMLSDMNDYVEIPFVSPFLSMWEYAIFLANGGNCKRENLGDCMGFDDCNKDLVWITFRELYLKEKATRVFLAMQTYAQNHGCINSKCIGVSQAGGIPTGCTNYPETLLAGRASRFGNPESLWFDVDDVASEQDAGAVAGSAPGADCSSNCATNADNWLADLSNCAPINNLTQAEKQALRDELIELCMLGCDQFNPMGATSTPSGVQTINGNTTLEEVLHKHLDGKPGYPNPNCSGYLITVPGPHKVQTDYENMLPKLDQCGCDLLMEVRADYQAGVANQTINPLTTSIESYLKVYKGISMDDIDNLLCVCDQFYDEANNQWMSGANASIIAAKKIVPEGLTCKENTSCKSCEEVNTAYSNAYAYALDEFGLNAAAFEASSNYQVILTARLNAEFAYDLSFNDYDFFHRGCNASSANPVCEINPAMSEFKDILTVLSMRGKWVHATTLNLVNENIVYRHSDLRSDEILGSNYSGVVNGNGHLIMTFQEGSQTPCTFDVSVPGEPAFDFSKVVSFGELWATSTNCTANGSFALELKYYNCGALVTKLAEVTNTCLQVNICYCGDGGQRLCNEPFFDPEFEEPCYQPTLDNMMQDAIAEYDQNVGTAYQEFKDTYRAKCADAFSTENFTLQGNFRFYNYTLFYYDQAGNLVKTVAPKGVNKLDASMNSAIDGMRATVGAPILPVNSYETKYKYNSYDQLVSTTNPDQEGASNYWYDFYGRMALSQNPQQSQNNQYSYIFYDKMGRPVESGLVVPGSAFNETTLLKVEDPSSTAFQNWVKAASSLRTEVTRTYYDKVFMTGTNVQSRFTLQPGQTQPGQQNLRMRVASVAYYVSVTTSTDFATAYASATHYTYDIHGNVLQTLQDVPELAIVKQDIKSTEYEFELLSGNMKAVKYQKDKVDQITHTYVYDKLNRLEEVFVSTDKVHQSRQAHYLYYDYGPLARIELGEQKVQGMDFAYTINGWLKAMNGTILNPGYELGRDNASGYLSQNSSVHDKFARDVVGFTIGYFDGDYQSIGSANFAPSPYSGTLGTAINQLYNGNIAYTSTAIADVPNSSIHMGVQMSVYRYDQLNRLVGARTFKSTGIESNNSWTGAFETQEYASSYSYDLNGNITHLTRNGGSSNIHMDDFTYTLQNVNNTAPLTGTHTSNRLDHVDDELSYNGNYTSDIDDQNTGNYSYDRLGQLIGDASEGMTIEWFPGNRKVKKITRPDKTIEFKYNPLGQRLLKNVTNLSTGIITTSYYVYDANGAVMGVYEVDLIGNNAKLTEQHIYGTSRIGMIDRDVIVCTATVQTADPVYPSINPIGHTLGYKRYEIANYLGNVNAVITDRKLYVGGTYEAVIVSNIDYYPFGMPMPGRNTNLSDYRFGYSGMEMNNEMYDNGNSYTTEFRQYDPRLGRWLSLDPLMVKYPNWSPYNYCLDNPILYIDQKGDDPITAILEAITSFGLSVGMSFIDNVAFQDMSIRDAVLNIDWFGASVDAGITYVMSSFVSGSGTSTKLARMAKTKAGKMTIAAITEFVSNVTTSFFNGDYDDENGDFDFDKLDLKKEFMKATAGVLIDNNFTKQADRMLKYYKISKKSLSKNRQKLLKNLTTKKADPKVRLKAIDNRLDKIKTDTKVIRNSSAKYVLDQAPRKVLNEVVDKKVIEKLHSGKTWIDPDTKKTPHEKGWFDKNDKLQNGLKCVYDEEGLLKEIQIWENGKDTGKKATLDDYDKYKI